jgi:hypothetical protein
MLPFTDGFDRREPCKSVLVRGMICSASPHVFALRFVPARRLIAVLESEATVT